MPHLFLLGAHIFFVGGAATHFNGLTADDFDPVAFQTDDLARVVGHDAELADALTSLGVVGITTNTLLPAATTAEPMQLQDAEAIVARFAQDFTMTSELEP